MYLKAFLRLLKLMKIISKKLIKFMRENCPDELSVTPVVINKLLEKINEEIKK